MEQAKSEKSIDVRLVNPFIDATVEVLSTMAQTRSSRKDVKLLQDSNMFGDVSGVIGILGEEIEGSVAITFTERLGAELVSRMLGMTPEEMSTADVNDGVGELVNMVAGKAKTILSGEGIRFELALPTVVRGAGHEIAHKLGTPCLVLIFETDEGEPFSVQVSVGK